MAPARTLLIAYFPREANKEEISNCLSKHGKVNRVHLIVEKDTKKPKCYGFVEFLSTEDVNAVLAATEGGAVTMVDTRDHMWHLRAERVRAFDKGMSGPSANLLGQGKFERPFAFSKKGIGMNAPMREDSTISPGLLPSGGPNAPFPPFPMMGMHGPPPPMNFGPPPMGFPNPRMPPPYGMPMPAPGPPPFEGMYGAPGLSPPDHLSPATGPSVRPGNLFQKEIERQATAKAAEMMAGFFHLYYYISKLKFEISFFFSKKFTTKQYCCVGLRACPWPEVWPWFLLICCTRFKKIQKKKNRLSSSGSAPNLPPGIDTGLPPSPVDFPSMAPGLEPSNTDWSNPTCTFF